MLPPRLRLQLVPKKLWDGGSHASAKADEVPGKHGPVRFPDSCRVADTVPESGNQQVAGVERVFVELRCSEVAEGN